MAVAFEDNEMDLSRIPVGENSPHEVNVIIEIPQGGAPVKYEVDKVSGAMFVDRFLHTAMFYPANYGFIPHTLSEDGDPIDGMVIAPTPVATGAVVRARPIGALLMEDEKGVDEKIIAVPVDKLHPFYKRVASYRDLPEILVEQIGHFFEHYKDLEKGKWVKVVRWVEPPEAIDLMRIGNRTGVNPPDDVNVVIEVPIGGEPIKYEMDKAAGTLVVDRFLHTPMRYPGNYGFVPHTLSQDGEPIAVQVANTRPIIPWRCHQCATIGMLRMVDDVGNRSKRLSPCPR